MAALRKKRPPKRKPAKPSVTPWKVEQLRFTAFLHAIPESIEKWWKCTTDEPPEVTSSNLREAKQRYEGTFERGRFILQSELNRVDWVVVVQVPLEEEYLEAPNIGLLDDV